MNATKGIVILTCLAVSTVIAYARAQGLDSYVIGWNDGEILLDPQGRTNSINMGPTTGFTDLAVLTQDLPPGTRINPHRHDRTEEVLFVHAGSGILTIGDQQLEVQEGDTIRVPPGTRHGIENPDGNLRIVAVVSPPGLDQAFREMFWQPGESAKELTPEQISEIGDRYDSISMPE